MQSGRHVGGGQETGYEPDCADLHLGNLTIGRADPFGPAAFITLVKRGQTIMSDIFLRSLTASAPRQEVSPSIHDLLMAIGKGRDVAVDHYLTAREIMITWTDPNGTKIRGVQEVACCCSHGSLLPWLTGIRPKGLGRLQFGILQPVGHKQWAPNSVNKALI